MQTEREGHSSRGAQDAEGRGQAALDEALLRPHLQRAIVEGLEAVQRAALQRGWLAAADLMARRLREERSLHSAERRLLGDALHQIVRGLRRLRALSGIDKPGALQLYLTWLLDLALAGGAVPQALRERAAAGGLDAAAVAARRAALEPPIAPEKLGEALSYPEWMVRSFVEDLGPEAAEAVLLGQNRRAPLTVRVNLLRGDRAALRARLAEAGIESSETPLSPYGLFLHTRVNVYGLDAFKEGWMELQDEGSQLIAELVAPPPGALIVDACAGAGGKTLALGSLMGSRGRIVSLDVDAHKLRELQKRARRAGLTNVQARVAPAGEWPQEVRAAVGRGAARVLVDAPCSGLGVLRRNPEARWRVGPADVVELAARQRAILDACAELVAPGGRLVYATCTVLRRENEGVIEGFLAAHPEFSPMPAKEILGGARAARIGDGERLRLLPTEAEGPDGFFAAVLRRIG